MTFQREKQNVSASELLQVLAEGDEIHLSRCTITGQLDINRLFDPAEKFQTEKLSLKQNGPNKTLTLAQSIVFDNCIFEENTVFSGPWVQPDDITVEFESDVIFNSSVFRGQSRFRNAVFYDVAGFDGCTFESVSTFKNAAFHKDAKFRTVCFNGYCLFGNAAFDGSVRFTNSHFAKGVNFSQARFNGETDFNSVYASSRSVPGCDAVLFAHRRFGVDESFWRFVKQSAQEAGYYQLAGEYFYRERCACLWQKFRGSGQASAGSSLIKPLQILWSVRLLPELVFGRLLFGYGERPARVLVTSALIIIFCAFIFSQPAALTSRSEPNDPSFLQGLYFSTITFTTLGYGDLYPSVEGFYRQAAMAEAVAGGCLMALFVVCLAKRFSRG